MKRGVEIKGLIALSCVAVLSTLCTVAYGGSDSHKLVFAIDGLSYSAFEYARSQGLFPSFEQSGQHIAPYPSMTEPSWTQIMGTESLFPLAGNIHTVEGDYFDIDSMTSVTDARNEFTREASPYNFYRAFDFYFNPFLEPLMYFPNESTTALEISSLETEISTGFTGDHYIAYISAVDATAHTQKNQLFPLLKKLSDSIEKIVAEQKQKNPDLVSWIISDHGNVGSFKEGEAESYLTPISLNAAASRAGLELVDGTLTKPNQIGMPIMALGNLGNVYFKDLSRRRDFAVQALQEPFVDIVTFMEVTQSGKYITILGANSSEARLYWKDGSYAYQAISGNPLAFPDNLVSKAGAQLQWIADSDLFNALTKTPYPDSAFRLVQNASKQVENEADLEVNLKDSYCFDGSFSKYVAMVRTHGSLSAHSSLGTVASTSAQVPAFIRSKDIMSLIGITPKEAFHQNSDLFHADQKDAIADSRALQSKGILTRVKDFSTDVLFRRLSNIITLSSDVISSAQITEMGDHLRKIFASGSASNGSSSNSQLAELQSKADVVAKALNGVDQKQFLDNLDKVFALKDLFASKQDPSTLVTQAKDQLLAIPGLGSLKDIDTLSSQMSSDSNSADMNTSLSLLRQGVMKAYTLPFFINEALDIPEFETVSDPRDLDFAQNWVEKNKQNAISHPGDLASKPALAQNLFQQIFTERKLVKQISPATFPLIYNPIPKDVTVVYIPGIYNELFDTEIFEKGLRALHQNLGLRVLYLDVDGRCSTGHNSKAIFDKLHEDTQDRLARGYAEPHYLILGYSKGGVDATEALLIDPEFTRKQIDGLVTIASPNHGTAILDTADLPDFVADNPVERPIPPECVNDPASESLKRSVRESFWNTHLSDLSGLTRFYSVSFVSSEEDANPLMKITKTIAHFSTPNDGVVTIESSKLPDALGAIDLGTMNADHLAGVAASNFPQGPFLESIMLTLFETQSLDKETTLAWYNDISQKSPYLIQDYARRSFTAKFLEASASSKESPVDVVGPLPDPSTSPNDSDDWYANISREQGMLATKISCSGQKDFSQFSDQLEKDLNGSAFSLRKFSLSCDEKGQMTLSIKSNSKMKWYEFWKKEPVQTFKVSTLADIVNHLLSDDLKSGKNLLEAATTPLSSLPKSTRVPFKLPSNTLGWASDQIINLKSLNSKLENAEIAPVLPANYPNGIDMVFDHQSTKDFRKEYGFSFESTSPGNEDDNPEIYYPVLMKGVEAQAPQSKNTDSKDAKDDQNEEVVLRMQSKDTSIRMTTPAIRFKPSDFRHVHLRIRVDKGATGADSAKGGNGKDDSAFKFWFTLRNLSSSSEDRSKFNSHDSTNIFGYYWSENPSTPAGALIENYYSDKNYVIVTLPKSMEIALSEGDSQNGQWVTFDRDLLADIQKAYPGEDPNNIEVVGMTIQTDSNVTHTSTESYFREMSFKP